MIDKKVLHRIGGDINHLFYTCQDEPAYVELAAVYQAWERYCAALQAVAAYPPESPVTEAMCLGSSTMASLASSWLTGLFAAAWRSVRMAERLSCILGL